ncbi:MAG: YfgM family protein [Sulfuriferula sp.]
MDFELDLDEQEKIDTLKNYWQRYANLITAVLAVAALSFAGVEWWQHMQQKQAAEASVLYTALQNAQKSNQTSVVSGTAQTLMSQYGTTAYAARGALIAAAMNVQANDLPTAQNELQWVLDHSKESGIKALAGLHLAEILLDENQAAAALMQLNAAHEEAFANLYNDLKGDALVMQNKRPEARAAYKIAIEKLPPDSQYRSTIETKLNAIGGVAGL